MRASACVGRIGGLAVALGVGAGIATGGIAVAWAAPAGDSSVNADSTAGPGSVRGAVRGTAGGPAATPRSAERRSAAATASRIATPVRKAVAALPLLPAGDPTPGSPAQSEPGVVTAAAVRRPGRRAAPAVAAQSVSTAQLLDPTAGARRAAVANAAGPNPIAVLLNNQTPTLSPTQTGQSQTGVVSGDLSGLDPDSSALSYTVVSAPAHGSVAVDAAGRYSYTLDPTLLHAGVTDTFRVTVSDAGAGFHIHGLVGLINLLTFGLIGDSRHTSTSTVTVTVTSVNDPPVTSVSVGAPDGVTGVVLGTVNAVDAEGDPLTYTGSNTTTKGAAVVAADGGFTYTPTAVARHAAAAPNATEADKADAFTITVSDGHGGVVALPVAVSVAPGNADPVASPTAGAPNASTGVVVGNVNAVDADGDPLSYSGSTTTTKGTVVVASGGSFTYTPTDTARHNAASVTATISQTTDTFTVTITDGYGATVAVPVTVTVGTANVAPVGVPSVGTPNASTGVVAGSVIASDADGDPLTYGGSATTAKGTVVVTAGGGFTYTPAAAARHAASSLTAIPADHTDTFTLTVSDGHGGNLAVPVSVTIAPANVAPIGAPSVGTPDATTGVVAGAILGADADGDALSYTGSTTTAKGGVVVSANGAFTYTPTALARHGAASPTATAAQTTDTFTVTVTDGHGGSIDVPVNVVISPAAVSFTFVYSTGSQYWTADSRSALQSAANTLASRIVVNAPVTLTYTLIGENTPNGQFLASALTTFSSSSPGYYGTVVQKKILTGVDANGGTADSQITWNFAYPWALGDTVANNQYDFQSVAMHELVHTFGIQSGIGNPASIDRNWTTFDSFLSTSNGTSVIGGDYVWDATYTANLTGGGGGLYFDGPNAVLAYGGPVPLYTPGTWIAGSSVSHLDPAHAPAGTTYLMDPTDLYGSSPRVFTPVEVGMLTDLGYTVSPGYAVFLMGVGFGRRRRSTRRD